MMKKIVVIALTMIMVGSFTIAAQEQDRSATHVIPLLFYDLVIFDSRTLHTPGVGLALTFGDMEPPTPAQTDNLLVAAIYRARVFESQPRFDYPRLYHDINFILHGKRGRHQYMVLFESYSDQPIFGGLRTLTFGGGYAYEVVNRQNGPTRHSFVLGGGLGIFYSGIKLADGRDWPLLPVPLIRYELRNPWFALTFDMKTKPALDFSIGAEQRFRFNAALGLTTLVPRRLRNFVYDFSLEYRFFDDDFMVGETHLGDFAGARVGFALNDTPGLVVGGSEDGSIKLSWYQIYATLDFSFLTVTTGYAFAGEAMYDDQHIYGLDDGLFLSVSLLYRF